MYQFEYYRYSLIRAQLCALIGAQLCALIGVQLQQKSQCGEMLTVS